MGKKKWLVLLLSMVLAGSLLTGCIDESLLSDEYMDAFEEEMETIQNRVESFTRYLTDAEMDDFETRVEMEMEAFADVFLPALEAITDDQGQQDADQLIALLDSFLAELNQIAIQLEEEYKPPLYIVSLTVNENRAIVNGIMADLDQPPVIVDSRTLVPLRFIGEALEAEITWNEEARTVTYVREGQEILLTIGDTTALVNGMPVELSVAPQIFSDRTLVPVRFISETLGYFVDWEEGEQRVVISARVLMPGLPEEVDEEVDLEVVETVLGVVTAVNAPGEEPLVGMLVDGKFISYPAAETLAAQVQEDWDHYSHWGLYQAGFNAAGTMVSLEYGEGVADIVGIFADYYTERTLADVLLVEGNTVTLMGVEYLLDSDDPEDLPGFSTEINDQLTPANGEIIQLSEDVVVYVEGEDGLFTLGTIELIDGDAFDYVEFYDVDGDLVYDIVIVWLI